MPPSSLCPACLSRPPAVRIPSSRAPACIPCFSAHVHSAVTRALGVSTTGTTTTTTTTTTNACSLLIPPGSTVAVAASGGKDSAVLAAVLNSLNISLGLRLNLVLLAIDEGIAGYRDAALDALASSAASLNLPLRVVSFIDLYGHSMDNIVAQIGHSNNCTFCGVLRRQALDRGAAFINASHLVTGHNADDIAETVIMNLLRGDFARLQRCTAIQTSTVISIPRSKPLKFVYEKEIVMYAYFNKLQYFSTECVYSPFAYRGFARSFIKDLESIRPSAILDIIHAGEAFQSSNPPQLNVPINGKIAVGTCGRCGYMSSNKLCKACLLLEGLNRGMPKLGIGKTDKIRRQIEIQDASTESSTPQSPQATTTETSSSSSDATALSKPHAKPKTTANVTLDW